ncbi:MAG: TIGR03936 family radical SAM-associated protein [Oscillospiraceae bacterium]|nr:TIGR03936 family radical SAM-associated protein [Oscillospiraceae bacterium]
MSDQRLLFRKEGRAIYISHLDLMRTFQRAFLRAGISIRHVGKFNPHPFISVAVPLSLGFSSQCELLDFGLEGGCTLEEVPARLNPALPEGLTILGAYEASRPTKEIGKLIWRLELLYDSGVPQGAEEQLTALFSRPALVMQKKSKKAKSGFTTVDLIPLMGAYRMERSEEALTLTIALAGQNPGLNPTLLGEAIGQECPGLKPDFLRACRVDILDQSGERFEGAQRDALTAGLAGTE